MSIEDHEKKIGGYPWSEKTDLEVAQHINLGLLLHDGISWQDAGFDQIIGINDAGLAVIARIIGKVREAAKS